MKQSSQRETLIASLNVIFWSYLTVLLISWNLENKEK